jgi:hypothetical protein
MWRDRASRPPRHDPALLLSPSLRGTVSQVFGPDLRASQRASINQSAQSANHATFRNSSLGALPTGGTDVPARLVTPSAGHLTNCYQRSLLQKAPVQRGTALQSGGGHRLILNRRTGALTGTLTVTRPASGSVKSIFTQPPGALNGAWGCRSSLLDEVHFLSHPLIDSPKWIDLFVRVQRLTSQIYPAAGQI